MQEQSLQKKTQALAMEQESYWAQQATMEWFLFGDKNTKYFQMVATIHKSKNHTWKIMDENGLWSEDKNAISQVFSKELCRRFKKDQKLLLQQKTLHLVITLGWLGWFPRRKFVKSFSRLAFWKLKDRMEYMRYSIKNVGLLLVRIFFLWIKHSCNMIPP